MKSKFLTHSLIISLFVIFSDFTKANEVKRVKNDRAMIQFSMDLRKGDTVEVTDSSGDVVGKGRVTAIRKNQAIVRLSSGAGYVKSGQKVRLPPAPFETGSDDYYEDDSDATKDPAPYRRSTKSNSERAFHLGLHLGYTLPQISNAKSSISYGALLGYQLSEKMNFSLNISSFSYSGLRFILPFIRGAYAPVDKLPLYIGAGVGASYVSFSGFSALDFGGKIFGNYELNLSPSISLTPELSWTYLFPVSSNTVNSYSLLDILVRFRYYF